MGGKTTSCIKLVRINYIDTISIKGDAKKMKNDHISKIIVYTRKNMYSSRDKYDFQKIYISVP